MTTRVSTAILTARLAPPPKEDPETLVTTTNQQIAAIIACPDYVNQQAVQADTKTLQTDTTALAASVVALSAARAAIEPLEAKRNGLIALVRRDRHNLGGTLTAVCGGVLASIKAWGATPGDASPIPESTAAPAVVLATASKKTSGTVNGKCTPVPGGATYFWVLSATPTPPAVGAPQVVTTGSRVAIAGQTVGQVMYLHVAVVRRRGGVSAWSDAAQVTVR